ncbi:MAG TPA: DNA-binding protein [Thermoanaerobaculia bacterium]|nr:DNA-binding protein [Thermoanaerobaculia bacterium]
MSRLEIVCDAGPLIHLHELSCLDLLADFQTVFVPEQVWAEVDRHRPAALTSLSFLRRVPVEISEDSRFQVLVRTFSLDLGEQAALSLMTLQPAAVLLTDDAAARLAAKALGYRIHGSIGVLLRSIRRGLRSRAEITTILRSLPFRSTLHIRQSLLQEILLDLEGGPPET